MSDLFYRNRRLLTLTIALIVVAGISAYESLPRLEDPVLISRDAIATAQFPGADAERVEALVTEKIEEELFDVEEIKTVASTSRAGVSIIEIELLDEVVDVDEVWSRVRDKLSDVEPELPAGALEPELEEVEVRGYALIAAVTWRHDNSVSYAVLRRLAEGLEDELRGIEGTEKVELFGEPDEEITVEVDAARLASMGLTVRDVSRQIGLSDSKVSAGLMRNEAAGDVLIEVEGEMDSLERIRRTPIHSGQKGQFVALSDIASVTKGIRQPAADLALVGGKPSVAVAAFVASDYRIDRWSAMAREKMAEYARNLPRGIRLDVLFDQSSYTEKRLVNLGQNLAIGASAVVLVMLLMMGWRAALVVSLALPLSTLMVLAGMQVLGIPLHQMSVTGLIIALGLLIDSAIVMVDEVQQRLRHGVTTREAIVRSAGHLVIPLLGSTVTTALAFAPIALMPGSTGEFVGTIAISVILALFSSLFVALTIIPALTGLISTSPPSKARGGSRWWRTGFSDSRLEAAYARALDRLFARPVAGIALSVALPIAGFASATQLIEQFFPPTGRDMFQIELELPNRASLAQTRSAAQRARSVMIVHPQVRDVHWFLGKSAPSFYYNLISDQEDAAFYAQGIVQLESAEETVELIRTLQNDLDEVLPEARVLVRQLEQGPPFDAPIELRLYGPNIDRLAKIGDEARAVLSAVPDVLHTDADLTETLPKLHVQVDEEEARLAGLDHATIAGQLDASLEGTVGGSLLEATEELPIRVRLADASRGDLVQIASLDLLPVAGSRRGPESVRPAARSRAFSGERQPVGSDLSREPYIPISALGDVELVPERAVVARRNGRRVNVVRGYISAGVLPGKVLADFRERLAADLQLPAGYDMEFGGEFAERNDSVGNLSTSVGVLFVAMAATLVLSLGSFRLAGIIAAVAALSSGLGLGSLWLFGYPFGFMAIVGTMGLIGVAINDSIVVLAAVHEDPRARAGDRGAIRAVVVRSSRHVLATTFTTIAGFLPLIIEGGGLWPPLVITIAGGVVGATLLALVFVPSSYLLVGKAKQVAKEREPSSSEPSPLEADHFILELTTA